MKSWQSVFLDVESIHKLYIGSVEPASKMQIQIQRGNTPSFSGASKSLAHTADFYRKRRSFCLSQMNFLSAHSTTVFGFPPSLQRFPVNDALSCLAKRALRKSCEGISTFYWFLEWEACLSTPHAARFLSLVTKTNDKYQLSLMS